jgi:hypothetical protein
LTEPNGDDDGTNYGGRRDRGRIVLQWRGGDGGDLIVVVVVFYCGCSYSGSQW